jgi:RNA polymerase sigma-70 factor (ECF subfamily)
MSEANDPHSTRLQAVAKRRCERSFAEIYRHFYPRIAAFLRNRGESARIAEEIAQDVMTAVWEKAPSFDPAKASCSTWIFTIARNAHIDRRRKEKRWEIDYNDPFFVPDPEPSPSEAQKAGAFEAELAAAIEKLPPEQAEILRRCYLGGQRHREAAAHLGLPITVVKYRARAAIESLRRILGAGT